MKLSPFYSSLIHLARELEASGVDGLVLFNRFYQPLAGARSGPAAAPVRLSDSSELPLRLRFSKILSGTLKGADLAVSGGVHTSVDVIRSVIAGASAVQVVSALLENGPQYLRVLREGMESLLARKGYRSLDELKASLCADPFPDPQAHSRASYMQLLQRWSA